MNKTQQESFCMKVMMNIKIIIVLNLLLYCHVSSQTFSIEKAEPPFWWTNMIHNEIQLMIYGENLGDIKAESVNPYLKVQSVKNAENDHYCFVNIALDKAASPGEYEIIFSKNGQSVKLKFSVLKRIRDEKRYKGFDNDDVIYLITPDRFANGDYSNDHFEGMRDHVNRDGLISRHGGDLQGIIDHLDYIKNLGFTTIWINPVIENNMDISYHGYAATDLYKIDPRFGDVNLYKKLVEMAHQKNMKIVMDHVSNHIGMYHPWIKNPPFENWIHGNMDNFVKSVHDKEILHDIYADSVLRKYVEEGWFVREMPDLNQDNPFLARYIIQNTIWWIELTGINGIREDTYPYCNPGFMSEWADEIFREYPDFNIVGEIWIQDPVYLSLYQENNILNRIIDTNLPSVTDYGLLETFGRILNRNHNIYELYKSMTRDILFPQPGLLLTFLDNHDTWRLRDVVKDDQERFKYALELLFTIRGIPQIYYGTEIFLKGGDDHGLIRRDFPGGFREDKRNAFTKEERTETENDIFDHLKKLIQIRRNNKALSHGEMIHFPPQENIYVFIREFEQNRIMVIVNNNKKEMSLNLEKYNHHLINCTGLYDLQSDLYIKYETNMNLDLEASDVLILRLECKS